MTGQRSLHRTLQCFLCAALVTGCGGAETIGGSSRELPFVVRLNQVRVLGTGGSEAAPAPGFANTADLTRRMAESLREAGAFTWVSLEADKNVSPDLEMQVDFIEPDFGAGQVQVVGALFSTVTWLLAGHLSWIIDNRDYPEARVLMRVDLRPPARASEAETETGDWFRDDLPLRGLSTNFYDRADMRYWALNILVPPWWDDGDPETAGESLIDRALEYFVENEPDRIFMALPGAYFRNRYCFLVQDEDDAAYVYIIAQEKVEEVGIRCDSGKKRVLRELVPEEEEAEEIRRQITGKVTGLGDLEDDFLYKVSLNDDERGYVRITARLQGLSTSGGQWTVFRERSAPSRE